MTRECIANIGRARIASFGEQGRRPHDHAADAGTALHGRLADESLPDRMRVVGRSQSLKGHYLLRRRQRGHGNHAGLHRLAIDMDRAGAALAKPAAKARTIQIESIAQNEEQRHAGIIDLDRDRLPVDMKGDAVRHGSFRDAAQASDDTQDQRSLSWR